MKQELEEEELQKMTGFSIASLISFKEDEEPKMKTAAGETLDEEDQEDREDLPDMEQVEDQQELGEEELQRLPDFTIAGLIGSQKYGGTEMEQKQQKLEEEKLVYLPG